MRIGIGIGEIAGTTGTIENLVAQAKQAEADGFASGWFANIFGMDAIIAATVCAQATILLSRLTPKRRPPTLMQVGTP